MVHLITPPLPPLPLLLCRSPVLAELSDRLEVHVKGPLEGVLDVLLPTRAASSLYLDREVQERVMQVGGQESAGWIDGQ